MPTFKDQIGNYVSLPGKPIRIISLVPSQTELLFDLGLGEEVVGITKFCIHPAEWFTTKQRVGGTKSVHLEIIDRLKPDLVIANKEENEKAQVDAIAAKYQVWSSDIHDLQTALAMITSLGQITGKTQRADEICHAIKKGFENLGVPYPTKCAAYYIWKDPWLTVGGDTFISDMMMRAGYLNIAKDLQRYPNLNPGELKGMNCEIILLSSEPYPFKTIHLEQLEKMTGIPVRLVDGEMFSWYGSRMIRATHYFSSLHTQ